MKHFQSILLNLYNYLSVGITMHSLESGQPLCMDLLGEEDRAGEVPVCAPTQGTEQPQPWWIHTYSTPALSTPLQKASF